MTDRHTEAVSFLRKLEAFFHSLARKEGLGYATGAWDHRRFGKLSYVAIFGQLGNLYVTLMCCGTDAYLKHGQVRLWWYLSDATEPFSFEQIRTTHRPMSERTVRGILDMGKTVLGSIRWLKSMSTVEEVMTDIFVRTVTPATKRGVAANDADNELPADGVLGEVDDEDLS